MIERRHQARSRQKIHSFCRERFGDLFAPDHFGDCIFVKIHFAIPTLFDVPFLCEVFKVAKDGG